jgi:hypothetical protein
MGFFAVCLLVVALGRAGQQVGLMKVFKIASAKARLQTKDLRLMQWSKIGKNGGIGHTAGA